MVIHYLDLIGKIAAYVGSLPTNLRTHSQWSNGPWPNGRQPMVLNVLLESVTCFRYHRLLCAKENLELQQGIVLSETGLRLDARRKEASGGLKCCSSTWAEFPDAPLNCSNFLFLFINCPLCLLLHWLLIFTSWFIKYFHTVSTLPFLFFYYSVFTLIIST